MTDMDKFELNENVKNSGEVSDGYHTFNELYEHRNLLFIALCMQVTEDCYFVKDHFEGWDLVLFDSALHRGLPDVVAHFLSGAFDKDY